MRVQSLNLGAKVKAIIPAFTLSRKVLRDNYAKQSYKKGGHGGDRDRGDRDRNRDRGDRGDRGDRRGDNGRDKGRDNNGRENGRYNNND